MNFKVVSKILALSVLASTADARVRTSFDLGWKVCKVIAINI